MFEWLKNTVAQEGQQNSKATTEQHRATKQNGLQHKKIHKTKSHFAETKFMTNLLASFSLA